MRNGNRFQAPYKWSGGFHDAFILVCCCSVGFCCFCPGADGDGLEKALAIRVASDTDPVLIAVTRFNLGRALWEAGQRQSGRRNVLEAEQELIAIGELGEEDLVAVQEWLAEH